MSSSLTRLIVEVCALSSQLLPGPQRPVAAGDTMALICAGLSHDLDVVVGPQDHDEAAAT